MIIVEESIEKMASLIKEVNEINEAYRPIVSQKYVSVSPDTEKTIELLINSIEEELKFLDYNLAEDGEFALSDGTVTTYKKYSMMVHEFISKNRMAIATARKFLKGYLK